MDYASLTESQFALCLGGLAFALESDGREDSKNLVQEAKRRLAVAWDADSARVVPLHEDAVYERAHMLERQLAESKEVIALLLEDKADLARRLEAAASASSVERP